MFNQYTIKRKVYEEIFPGIGSCFLHFNSHGSNSLVGIIRFRDTRRRKGQPTGEKQLTKWEYST
jgi:hypothetical protein